MIPLRGAHVKVCSSQQCVQIHTSCNARDDFRSACMISLDGRWGTSSYGLLMGSFYWDQTGEATAVLSSGGPRHDLHINIFSPQFLYGTIFNLHADLCGQISSTDMKQWANRRNGAYVPSCWKLAVEEQPAPGSSMLCKLQPALRTSFIPSPGHVPSVIRGANT